MKQELKPSSRTWVDRVRGSICEYRKHSASEIGM
jgi:hypothetical protein